MTHMPTRRTGYLTKSGKFFDTEKEAEYQESFEELREAALSKEYDPDAIVQACQSLHAEIIRYCNAFVDHYPTDFARAEEAAPPIQQQPTGSDEPMPDVGSRKRTKTIFKQREGDGT